MLGMSKAHVWLIMTLCLSNNIYAYCSKLVIQKNTSNTHKIQIRYINTKNTIHIHTYKMQIGYIHAYINKRQIRYIHKIKIRYIHTINTNNIHKNANRYTHKRQIRYILTFIRKTHIKYKIIYLHTYIHTIIHTYTKIINHIHTCPNYKSDTHMHTHKIQNRNIHKYAQNTN